MNLWHSSSKGLRALWRTILLLCILLTATQLLWAQSPNQAALVIVHGNGELISRCVAFSEAQISGYELLQRAELDLSIEVSGTGAAICRIDNEGCDYPQQSCFCGTEGDQYIYWSYWQLSEESWQYANMGASNTQVQPGAVQGWVRGSGSNNAATPPPPVTFGDLCAPATPTGTATATPSLTPTATSIVTATATTALTPTPSATATATTVVIPSATPSATPFPTATALPVNSATPQPPHILLFQVEPAMIVAGQSATLLWQVRDATEVTLQVGSDVQQIGAVGNQAVQPQNATQYTLVARNGAGQVMATAMVDIVLPTATSTLFPSATPTVAPFFTTTVTAALTTTVTMSPTATAIVLPTVEQQAMPEVGATVVPASPTATVTEVPLQATTPLSAVAEIATIDLVTLAPVTTITAVSATPAISPQLQLFTLLGGLLLMVMVPLLLLGGAVLLWATRNNK